MKQCTKCGEMKAFAEFSRGQDKFGLYAWCKKCDAEKKRQNRQRQQTRRLEWRTPQFSSIAHKKCSKCGDMKTFLEFYPHTEGRFGLRPDCKSCVTIIQNAYHLRERERRLAGMRKYSAANKAALSAQRKAHYPKVRAERLTYYKAWRAANPEIKSAGDKAYRKTPKGIAAHKLGNHKRRSRAQFAVDTLITSDAIQHWEKDGAVCYLTGTNLMPGSVTWDHVVPLYWGGTNDVWNFLPASQYANSSKRENLVYFDIATRQAQYTTDPCPGGVGPSGETWPRIPLTQPTMDQMQAMVDAWKARRKEQERESQYAA